MKVVLSLGRLHPLKGLDLLVSAWAEVVRSSKVLKCESAKVGGGETVGSVERSSKVLKCESAKVGGGETVGSVERSSKVLKCESAKVAEECMDTVMHAKNFRTLELPNFRTSSWQLVIAGPDEQGTKEKLKIESETLKLKWCECAGMDACEKDADIIFMGSVQGEEKWALMQRADIFVLPSRSENFGMVVGEALSCGVPVVTTAVGPWGESGEVLKCESAKVLKLREKRSSSRQYQLTVGEGENIEHSTSNIEHPTGDGEVLKLEEKLETANCQLPTGNLDRGLIVVETSVEGVSEGLRQMMALSDAERKELGQRGCEWVKREFSWESVAQEMLRAYKLK